MSTERIAVLGAGPMGLGAAYQLVKDGRKPIIFEADDRVGGMAACFDFGGLSIERYYHFHAISDHAFLEVLRLAASALSTVACWPCRRESWRYRKQSGVGNWPGW